MPKPECQIHRLGTLDYPVAWELQVALAREVQEGTRPSALLLLEHPSVYTIGRRGSRDQVHLDDAQLASLGVAVYEADRGGQVTYHGPGQLVAYPIVDLRGWGGPVKYVRTLERTILETLADFGIAASLVEGLTGVWVEGEKIAAIGVKVSRGVAYHGLAINVNPDLGFFDHIIPCGITDRGVTSMERVLGRALEMELVAYSLAYHFGAGMGLRMVESELPPVSQVVRVGPSPETTPAGAQS